MMEESIFESGAEKSDTKDPDHTVSGVVKDEYGDPAPGVNIVLRNTTIGTVTDVNGQFEFPSKLNEGDILVFSFIGFKTKEYQVSNKIQEGVEIVMSLDMDVEIMGEIALGGHYKPGKTGVRGLWSKVKSLF